MTRMAGDSMKQRIYAGVGSRKTPAEMLSVMGALAGRMEQDNWLLRTGEASGADAAFRGGVRDPAHRTIYMPAARARGLVADPRQRIVDASSLASWPQALETVTKYHPSKIYQEAAVEMAGTGGLPLRVTEIKRQQYGPKIDPRTGMPMTLQKEAENLAYGVSLQARNAMQVMGPKLDRPADLLVAWTPGGEVKGGTGQSLRMAEDLGIEVRNLGKPDVLQRVRQYLGMGS